MKIPAFSELPVDKNGPHHNAWGLYGPKDELGTLNRLTDDIVAAAAKEIQTGTRVSVNWPLDAQLDLPFFGRQAFHKEVYQKPPRIINDDVWTFNTQSSSQWDGLRHFGYQKEERFYNGVTLDMIHGTNGCTKSDVNGIGAWSEHGIVGRGILLDYHAWRIKHDKPHDAFGPSGISASDLLQVAHEQGTEIKFGDILLVRSGYMDAYSKLKREEIETMRSKQPLTFAGVEQSDDMMEFLWTNFSAAGGDHPSWEQWPTQKEYHLHEVMLAGWGMPIGELFDLEKLALQCKKLGRWSFYFMGIELSGQRKSILIQTCITSLRNPQQTTVRRIIFHPQCPHSFTTRIHLHKSITYVPQH
ncbi:Hypothetical protein R9X50_00562500 [Acrodontium crateriforme]|uniref:Cyclase n=1 Tax=Acrodontium crateriforme TaxID=150365 RepID=A0AAQ3M6I0_9PEZI|nr:Hypothetical protein R9X50_00562500 [Acrodontium crateriforme]